MLLHLNCLLLRQVLANPVPPEITSSMSRESIISSVFNMLEESEPEDEELVSIFPRNMEKRNTKLRPMKAVFLKREVRLTFACEKPVL